MAQFDSNRQNASNNPSFVGKLASAVQSDELCLHFQPRFEFNQNQAVTLEALLRWQRPDVGLLYPEAFISVAEDNALIFQLDLWAFERCCHDLVWLRDNLDENIRLAVNFSVLSCESVYFAQKIIELCNKYGILLSDFIIEISSSSNMSDIRKLKAFCETLGNHGASFCVDDFGVGHTNLKILEQINIDHIKIDRSFVSNIGISDRSETIIKHILRLANDLGISATGEGIEDTTQLKFLRQNGCQQAQGFYLGRPTAIDRLNESLLCR